MIRWGIIGTGHVANEFATALRTLSDTEITAIGSRELTRANGFAKRHGINATSIGYQTLIDRDDVDVLYVATPNSSHVEISTAAIMAGKAVVCEKPIACDGAGIDRIIVESKASQLFCMEAMWMRFMPVIRRAISMVNRGDIGSPLHFQADFTQPAPFDAANRFFSKELGGGCLLDRGIYGISLAHALFGKPISVSADAVMSQTGVDEHTVVHLRHGNATAALSTITCGLSSWGTNDATIMGTEGVLRIHQPFFRPECLSFQRFSKPIEDSQSNTSDFNLSRRRPASLGRWIVRAKLVKQMLTPNTHRFIEPLACNGYEYEAMEVIRCLNLGEQESSLMSLNDSRDVMLTLDRARESFLSNKEPGGNGS